MAQVIQVYEMKRFEWKNARDKNSEENIESYIQIEGVFGVVVPLVRNEGADEGVIQQLYTIVLQLTTVRDVKL